MFEILKYSQKFAHIKRVRLIYETENYYTFGIESSIGLSGIGSGSENIKIKMPKKTSMIGPYENGIVEDLVYEI